jgi:hypothetical protein
MNMCVSPFEERMPYYQYEQIFLGGRFQPVVSTWAYLGKHVLLNEVTPESMIGYVFAYWNPTFGWRATSVTRTFWSLETAKQTMLTCHAFSGLILTQFRTPSSRCCTRGLVDLDAIFSVIGNADAPECEEASDDRNERQMYRQGDLFYQTGFILEPRAVVCQTYLSEGPARSVLNAQDGMTRQNLRFSAVFSRGLGIEKLGTPVFDCNPSYFTWDEWCARMSKMIKELSQWCHGQGNFDNRTGGDENAAE